MISVIPMVISVFPATHSSCCFLYWLVSCNNICACTHAFVKLMTKSWSWRMGQWRVRSSSKKREGNRFLVTLCWHMCYDFSAEFWVRIAWCKIFSPLPAPVLVTHCHFGVSSVNYSDSVVTASLSPGLLCGLVCFSFDGISSLTESSVTWFHSCLVTWWECIFFLLTLLFIYLFLLRNSVNKRFNKFTYRYFTHR